MPSQSYLPVFASIVCLTGAVAEASLIGQATANGVLKENTWIIAGQACEAMFNASEATLLYVYISDELNRIQGGTKFRNWPEEDQIDPVPSAVAALLVLAATMEFIQIIGVLNGFGPSDTGGEFRDGSNQFHTEVSEPLENASYAAWHGESAEEYKSQNDYQKQRVQQMAEIDQQIASILQDQATQVEKVRVELLVLLLGLGRTMWQALRWYAECTDHRQNSVAAMNTGNFTLAKAEYEQAVLWAKKLWWFSSAVILAAVGTVLYLLEHLCYKVTKNSQKVFRDAQESYHSIVGNTTTYAPPGPAHPIGGPAVAKSTNANFFGIANSPSDMADEGDAATRHPHDRPTAAHLSPDTTDVHSLSSPSGPAISALSTPPMSNRSGTSQDNPKRSEALTTQRPASNANPQTADEEVPATGAPPAKTTTVSYAGSKLLRHEAEGLL